MNMLALETSGPVAGVALFRDAHLVFEEYLDNKLTHSQVLMPMVERGLTAAGMRAEDVDCFSCAVGPGSFTGVRIGVATVKALAYGLSKPVLGVNTLDALAYNVIAHRGHILAAMDARCAQVYAAEYVSDGQRLERAGEYRAAPVEACLASLPEGDVLIVGDGARSYREMWETDVRVRLAPAHLMRQRASSVGACALAMLDAGVRPQDPFSLEPVYLRLPQAEREYRRRLKEQSK